MADKKSFSVEIGDSEQNERKILSALGLCSRARALVMGTQLVCDSMHSKNAPKLVLEASDTSENTHKRIKDKCIYYNIRYIRLRSTSAEISEAVGKTSSVAALGITDENFCKLLDKYIEQY